MVYHVKSAGTQAFRKLTLIIFLVVWGVLAGGTFVADELLGTGKSTPFLCYTALAMALPAALVAWHEHTKMRRGAARLNNTFYTLTQGGLLIEQGLHRNAVYLRWAGVADVTRAGKTVYLHLTTGRGFSCVLADQTEERIRQFADFATEHAGTTAPDSALTPPPAEALCGTPLHFSATPEQRREQSDTIALHQDPAMGIRRLVFLLLWAGLLLWAAYEARYTTMLLALGMMLWQVHKLNRPGESAEKLRSIPPRTCYTGNGQFLIINPMGWHLNRKPQVNTPYTLQHGTCICLQDEIPLMIDHGQELPPHLQAPPQPRPRRLHGNLLYALLAALLALAAWCFTHSNTWHLHCIMQGKGDPAAHATALLNLPPGTPLASVRAAALRPDTNILYHSGALPHAVCLQLITADGNTAFYLFSPEAELTETIDSETSSYIDVPLQEE